MKRLFTLSLVVFFAFVSGALGGTVTPIYLAPGDVNGDGRLNIADVSYLANFLFGIPPALPPAVCEPNATAIEGFTVLGVNAQGYLEYTHDQTGIVFVKLPGGVFNMGSPDTEPNGGTGERPVHEVTLSPFLIAKTEVTQAQYEAVMGSNPSFHTGDDQRPLESVSWDALRSPVGFLARTGLSLPSEAQWEYAARAGTSTAFSFGDDCNARICDPCATADDFMWWCANSGVGLPGATTHPVAEKQPNPFGLHDMHGNVWEWCEDVLDFDFYSSPDAAGPDPVSTSGSELRVVRGGGYANGAGNCRSAFRFLDGVPGNGKIDLGFRPAIPLP